MSRRVVRGVAAPVVLAIAAAVAVAVGACGAASSSARQVKAASSQTIAVSIGFHNPWLDPYGAELQKLAKQHGIGVTVNYGDATAATQASQINTIIAQKPSLIIYVVADANAGVASLAQIKQAGIPVLASIVPPATAGNKYETAYYGPNDFTQASLNAKALARYLKAHGHRCGQVAIIRGAAGGSDNTDRAAGFRAELKKVDPCLKIVADQNSDWQSDPVAYNVATAILRQHPKVAGILTEADTIAAGAAKAVSTLHLKGKVAITGLGGSCQGFTMLKKGQIVADTLQDPVLGAQGAFAVAQKILAGKSVGKIQYMALPVLTAKNVRQYKCHW